jgi:hypothetical protein
MYKTEINWHRSGNRCDLRSFEKSSEMNANRCNCEALEYRVPVCLIKYCHIINVGTARDRAVFFFFFSISYADDSVHSDKAPSIRA